jgi:hypothetical protein
MSKIPPEILKSIGEDSKAIHLIEAIQQGLVGDKKETPESLANAVLNAVSKKFPSPKEFKSLSISDLPKYDIGIESLSDKFFTSEGAEGINNMADTFHTSTNRPILAIEKEVANSVWIKNDPSNASFDEVKWSAPSLHLQYEKSNSASLLLQRTTRSALIKLAQRCKLKDSDVYQVVCMDKIFRDHGLGMHDNIILWKVMESNKWTRGGWLKGSDTFRDIKRVYLNDRFDIDGSVHYFVWAGHDADKNCNKNSREKSIKDLEKAYKIMAYSSIIYTRPEAISRKDKKAIKKLTNNGVKVPSKGQVYRVVALPKVIKERLQKESDARATQGKGLPNGRAGHMRYFRNARYTNMRGQWGFVMPVCDSKGNLPKTMFRVTKAKEEYAPYDPD